MGIGAKRCLGERGVLISGGTGFKIGNWLNSSLTLALDFRFRFNSFIFSRAGSVLTKTEKPTVLKPLCGTETKIL